METNKINYLYFDVGLTKTQICRLLNFTTYIEDVDLNNYLTKFLPPGINNPGFPYIKKTDLW